MSDPSRPRGFAGLRAVGLGLAIALAGGGAAMVLRQPAGPPLAHAAEEPLVEIHAAHRTSFVPALDGKRPLYILALGSDARPGQAVARLRADSIHLIGLNPRRGRATVLGFPRDSWVSIPGHGTSKINDAMAYGGPGLMVRTVEGLTGIRIDFWLLTSFQGLERMVNAIGGISVDVPYPMHDRYSGADFRAGRQRLKGGEALALARNRHDTPRGDFSRSLNQGLLLVSALKELRKDFDHEPTVLFAWLAALWRNVQTDLSPKTLLDLGLTATQISPSKVKNLVVPGTTGSAGGASVVFISSSARSIYADMRRDGVVG